MRKATREMAKDLPASQKTACNYSMRPENQRNHHKFYTT